MKRKCIGWMLGTTCDLDLWPYSWPWPWMFQGQISKELYLRNWWSDWCEIKIKWVNMTLGRLYDLALWPHPWPWPWSWNFKVKVWNSFISGMGRPIDMERKYVSHPFMTMILTSVTMVGWADVPDSDWGDFRRRRAVDLCRELVCTWWNGRDTMDVIIFFISRPINLEISWKNYFFWTNHRYFMIKNPLSQFTTKMGFCCKIWSLNDLTQSPISRPGTHCLQWQRANARANLWSGDDDTSLFPAKPASR